MEGIRIFSPNTCKGPGNNFIENVVYYELLDDHATPIHIDEMLADDSENIQIYDAGALDDQFEDHSDSDTEMQPC